MLASILEVEEEYAIAMKCCTFPSICATAYQTSVTACPDNHCSILDYQLLTLFPNCKVIHSTSAISLFVTSGFASRKPCAFWILETGCKISRGIIYGQSSLLDHRFKQR